MLLLLPVDCRFRTATVPRYRPWFSLTVVVLVILVQLIEQAALRLPVAGWLELARWRLYTDPELQLFSWWQLWSHLLIHQGWPMTLINTVVWWAVARAVERRLGAFMLLATVGVATPIAAGVFLWMGEGSGDPGLAVAICCALGMALGIDEGARLVFWGGWWWVHLAGRWRFTLPLSALALVYVGGELLRQWAVVGWQAEWQAYLTLSALSFALALILGHLIVRLALGGRPVDGPD